MNKLEFDLLDCTFISREEYNYIKRTFKEFEGIKFGYKLNSKNEEIYFVKDSFKESYEKPSIYKISYNWQDKYDNY